MPPVRVKVYGLFPMTRSTYLTIQGAGFVLVMAAVGVIYYWPQPILTPNPTPMQRTILFLHDWFPAIALLILVLEALETFFVLRRFAVKQAQEDRQADFVSNSSSEVR